MTERDTIARAKLYLDKLAAGVNPLDDKPVPPSDVILQPRLSRCFQYVSTVLEQVLEGKPPLAPAPASEINPAARPLVPPAKPEPPRVMKPAPGAQYHGAAWTDAQDKCLASMHESGIPMHQLTVMLKHSEADVAARLRYWGLSK